MSVVEKHMGDLISCSCLGVYIVVPYEKYLSCKRFNEMIPEISPIGEEVTLKNGDKAKCIGYHNRKEILVMDENNILRVMSYKEFKNLKSKKSFIAVGCIRRENNVNYYITEKKGRICTVRTNTGETFSDIDISEFYTVSCKNTGVYCSEPIEHSFF